MKLLTIPKSFLKNRFLYNSIKVGLLTGILISIPIFILFFYINIESNNKSLIQTRKAQELIFLDSFNTVARYGDFVNAKEKVLQQGKALGLNDLIICNESNNEVLPSFQQDRCLQFGYDQKIIINDLKIQIIFVWNTPPTNYIELIIFSMLISLTISVPSLLLGSLLAYRSILKVVKIYVKLIEGRALVEADLMEDIDVKEFKPIVDLLRYFKRKILDSANDLNRLKINEATVSQARQVAHDIRSPLSVLNILVPTLISSNSNEKSELLNDALKRINSIADDLLKKKTASQKVRKILTLKEVNRIIENVIKEKSLVVNRELINFKINLSSFGDGFSFISESDLSRIVSNLINNSIEAIENAGVIQITSIVKENKINLEIRDSGVGISPDILELLGKQKVSLKNSMLKPPGNGLGVFHAQSILTSINGSMKYLSDLGKGTTVIIEI